MLSQRLFSKYKSKISKICDQQQYCRTYRAYRNNSRVFSVSGSLKKAKDLIEVIKISIGLGKPSTRVKISRVENALKKYVYIFSFGFGKYSVYIMI